MREGEKDTHREEERTFLRNWKIRLLLSVYIYVWVCMRTYISEHFKPLTLPIVSIFLPLSDSL